VQLNGKTLCMWRRRRSRQKQEHSGTPLSPHGVPVDFTFSYVKFCFVLILLFQHSKLRFCGTIEANLFRVSGLFCKLLLCSVGADGFTKYPHFPARLPSRFGRNFWGLEVASHERALKIETGNPPLLSQCGGGSDMCGVIATVTINREARGIMPDV
jgi:hypothetical protein